MIKHNENKIEKPKQISPKHNPMSSDKTQYLTIDRIILEGMECPLKKEEYNW